MERVTMRHGPSRSGFEAVTAYTLLAMLDGLGMPWQERFRLRVHRTSPTGQWVPLERHRRKKRLLRNGGVTWVRNASTSAVARSGTERLKTCKVKLEHASSWPCALQDDHTIMMLTSESYESLQLVWEALNACHTYYPDTSTGKGNQIGYTHRCYRPSLLSILPRLIEVGTLCSCGGAG